MFCANCGKNMSESAPVCPHCGHPNSVKSGKKSKVVFVLLALFLGGLGIHRMYISDWGLGIVYLLFCWTSIPLFIALIEAFVIGLNKNDPRFE